MNYISHRLIEDMHICYFIPHLPQNSGLLVINLDCSSTERCDSKPEKFEFVLIDGAYDLTIISNTYIELILGAAIEII